MLKGMLMALAVLAGTTVSHANDKVSLVLEWRLQGAHAPFILAKKRGYFAQQGIDIDITPGGGSSKTVAIVGSNGATFGLADGSSLVANAAQGMPVKYVAAINNASVYAICLRKDSGIKNIKDIEGHTIAFTAGSAQATFLPAIMKFHDIDASKVRLVNMDPASALASVADRKTDGVLCGIDDQGLVLQDQGIDTTVWSFADLGLPAVGKGIVATDATIKEQPDLIRRFLVAVKMGVEAVKENPEEGVQAVLEAQDPAARQSAFLIKRHMEVNMGLIKPRSDGRLLGVERSLLEGQIDLMKRFGGLKTEKAPSDFYTDAFLPQ